MNLSNSRTFRFFVSSTFSDFKKERDILRTEIFPEIKKYYEERGCTFQPIDLRWGINEEAQLDQKTLELCLEEVKFCKQYPAPNFLIMLGDRYGWVPLPYMIEKQEFELLLPHCSGSDKSLLKEWYLLDYNQIPASYILKERTDEAIDFKRWNVLEKKVLSALQKAVLEVLPPNKQERYFQSVSESEIIEGLYEYRGETENQKKLLEFNPELKSKDSKSVLTFLRTIDLENSILTSSEFVDVDKSKINGLKNEVKDILSKENTLSITTTQINEAELDYWYLEVFREKITEHLKKTLNELNLPNYKNPTSDFELEAKLQLNFAKQKREDFLGREEILQQIHDYILNEDRRPLVIHGPSGIGKTSLMAKAIQNTEYLDSYQIVYRFVGASLNSDRMTSILLSILEELGIEFNTELNNQGYENNSEQRFNLEENYNNWSFTIHDQLLSISKPSVLFIDAVDQLNNPDDFNWLPKKLPKNLKIILSTLNDENYQLDSIYFEKLKKRTDNLFEVPTFDIENGIQLLKNLLKKKKRKLQEHQIEYFKNKFKKTLSPLYVLLASHELMDWKSFDKVSPVQGNKNNTNKYLFSSTKELVMEYIHNLSQIYFHNEQLVNRILDCLVLSGIGVSQYEIVTLLNLDKKFVEEVVSNTFHVNVNGEIPDVIWIRLYRQLIHFFKISYSNHQILHSFFHREFVDNISTGTSYSSSNDFLIKSCQKKVDEIQNLDVNQNRWGEFYLNILIVTVVEFGKLRLSKYVGHVTTLHTPWMSQFLGHLKYMTEGLIEASDFEYGLSYMETFSECVNVLYNKNKKLWYFSYCQSLMNFVFIYRITEQLEKSLSFAIKAHHLIEKRFKEKNDNAYDYLYIINELSGIYSLFYKFESAIDVVKVGIELSESLYKENPKKYGSDYIRLVSNLAGFYDSINNSASSIKFAKKAKLEADKLRSLDFIDSLDFHFAKRRLAGTYFSANQVEKSKIIIHDSYIEIKELFKKSPIKYVEDYVLTSLTLATNYFWLNDLENGFEILQSAIKTLYPFYKRNPRIYAETYTSLLLQLAGQFIHLGSFEQSLPLLSESERIISPLFAENEIRWTDKYAQVLYNFSNHYLSTKDSLQAISFAEKCVKVSKLGYNPQSSRGFEQYCLSISLLVGCYREAKEFVKAIHLLDEVLELLEPIYKKSPIRWVRRYTFILRDLAFTIKENGNIKEAMSLEHKVIETLENHYQDNPNLWADDYALTINNLAYSYEWSNQLEESVILHEKAIEIRRDLFQRHNGRWISDFANSLGSAQRIYSKLENAKEGLHHAIESINVAKPFYENDSSQYAPMYFTFLYNKAFFLQKMESIKDSINTNEALLQLEEKFMNEFPERWIHQHTHSLELLSSSLKLSDRLPEAIQVKSKSLQKLENQFASDPDAWAELYTITLNQLSRLYEANGELEKSVELETKNVKIRKHYFTMDSSHWWFMYSVSLSNLSNTLSNLNMFDSALPLQLEALEVVKPMFNGNPSNNINSLIHVYRSLLYTYQNQKKHKKAKYLLLEIKSLISTALGNNHEEIEVIDKGLEDLQNKI